MSDPEKLKSCWSERKIRTLRTTIYICLIIAALALIKAIIDGVLIRMCSLTFGVGTIVFAFFCLKRNRLVLARECLLIGMWIAIVFAVLTSGGVHEVAVFWFAVLICLVGLFGSVRSVVCWGFCSFFSVVGIFLLESRIIVFDGIEVGAPTVGHTRFHVVAQFAVIIAIISNFINQFNRYEQDLVLQLDQLKEEVELRKQAEEKVEKALVAKTNFFANVSHEMRTPLNSIVGFSSRLLKRTNVYTEQDLRPIKVIHKNGHSLVLLINDLLELSELDSISEMIREKLNCFEVLDAFTESLKSVANRYGIFLVLSSTEDVEVVCNRSAFQKIFMALLNFSIRQTIKGGVTVRLEYGVIREKVAAKIVVEDTSKGMTEEQMSKLFDLHYDIVLNSDRELSSSALSLVLARRLAELNGCTLEAYARERGGVKFDWCIPLAKSGD